ncbi:MAG: hypothetical protein ACW98K_04250 [Candidatus Kariarchaeaceae archaeon]|jgi:hypothetical protein
MFKEIHAYCSACDSVIWFKVDPEVLKKNLVSGLYKTSFQHSDHTFVCAIDTNYSVRSQEIVDIHPNPIKQLVEYVANTFYSINQDDGRQIHIDFYTSNPELSKFMRRIISGLLDIANVDSTGHNRMIISTYKTSTIASADRLHLSLGPHILEEIDFLENQQNGLVLDIKEAERHKLVIEDTFGLYDWIAVLVPKEEKDNYSHAISSICTQYSLPFFIGVTNTNSLRDLFDFIFAVAGL